MTSLEDQDFTQPKAITFTTESSPTNALRKTKITAYQNYKGPSFIESKESKIN